MAGGGRGAVSGIDRRAFVHTAGAVAGSLLLTRSARGAPNQTWNPASRQADLLLRGAVVFDGTGAPAVEADVAITGDRISSVGRSLTESGAVEVDLTGLALAPGFIDIHSHTDLELLVNPRAESKIRQGVTTEIAGQDGSSTGPWTADRAASMRDTYRSRYGVELDFSDLPGFLGSLERQAAAVNLASMIGHGTVRGYVMGNDDRPATDAELAHMQSLITRALEAGACGLSTGLEYTPGAFANLDELVALAALLKGTGFPYATHMRNEDDQLFAAIEEALNVGQRAQVPVHISHLKAQGTSNWWKVDPVLETLEAARADGLEVTYDRYPYVAYSTGLGLLFPLWARDGGTDALLARLEDVLVAGRIEAAVRDKIGRAKFTELDKQRNAFLASLNPVQREFLLRNTHLRPVDPQMIAILDRAGAIGTVKNIRESEAARDRFRANPVRIDVGEVPEREISATSQPTGPPQPFRISPEGAADIARLTAPQR